MQHITFVVRSDILCPVFQQVLQLKENLKPITFPQSEIFIFLINKL